MHAAKECVKALYKALMSEDMLLSTQYQELLRKRSKHRVVADFIASMTDRYAMKLYHELYGFKF